ncbi:DNA repair protein REV1 [Platanthera zijinensis]|uniref:DNA repair protein REV1 n=1 Tax=Platanthera zijinensis TaxID=2320716 RepID=A0AAP0B2V6_9ASPA
MRSSSPTSASGRSTKRSKSNPKTPVQKSPFADFGSYLAEKNRKLRSQFQAETSFSGDGKGIFHGVSIFVDGHTVPSSQELKGHMLRHGGRCENYFSRSRVTHIICSNLPDSKMKNTLFSSTLEGPSYELAEHSSKICKQQKLPAFFGCKSISSLKDVEVLSDIQSNSRAADGFGELSNTKCLHTSDVHHSTLTDPNFHSRLHFIGTWRNRYRKRFCNMLKGECIKSNVDSSTSTYKTSIIHIDMDSFFVSVILRKYPELLDKPVAVCHSNNSKGTAEISSANYPARNYGVSAGMFVRDAKACCPNLVVFPYNFEAYEEVADQFYSILHKHCNKVQALSCDEAFLDISEFSDLDPENFSSVIRKEIEETTQCTASAGIAGNLLMARLATKFAKPNGQCYIPSEKVESFLDDLPIMALPGIGRAIGDKLESKQLRTCGQLRLISKKTLHKDFGAKVGDMLWNYCRGIDDRKVEVLKETKSIGAEVNWGVRFLNTMDVKRRRAGAKDPLKFMGCGDCENISRSMTLPVATDDATLIQRTAKQIFASYHIDVTEVRGAGLQMSKLEVMGTNKQGSPALPPVCLLDMSVIKDLPVDIISEMNDAYNGKLYDLMRKHDEDQKSKINLWSGSPPKWVEKFEVSNSLILNLTAQLYAKYGVDKLLSPILQLLISLYPLILRSSSEEPLEVRFDLCELLLQYIELKIDSDVEELYLCYLLLERYF